MLQHATLLRNSAPWLPNISDEHVSCTALQKPTLLAHFWRRAKSIAPAMRDPQNVLRDRSFFYTFDFEMCFVPQRRALFKHLNFQKCSAHVVSLAFSIRNVLRTTTACTFSASQLPKVLRHWGALNLLTSKCASRQNAVHFLNISTSKSAPNLWCL